MQRSTQLVITALLSSGCDQVQRYQVPAVDSYSDYETANAADSEMLSETLLLSGRAMAVAGSRVPTVCDHYLSAAAEQMQMAPVAHVGDLLQPTVGAGS